MQPGPNMPGHLSGPVRMHAYLWNVSSMKCSHFQEARRRRNEGSVELRKKKNFEQLMKRRNIEEGELDLVASPEKVYFIYFFQFN